MAYSKELADRIRTVLGDQVGLTEREMFGGVGFMVQGNVAVGVIGDDLMVRIDKQETERALDEPGARIFDFTGRPMKGWLMVGGEGLSTDQEFKRWVQRGVDYASSLPAK